MRRGTILFFLFGIIIAFQNCGPANFSSVAAGIESVGGRTGGSNGGFDGKDDFALNTVPIGKIVTLTVYGAGSLNPDLAGSKIVYQFENEGIGVLHMAVDIKGAATITLSEQAGAVNGNLLLARADSSKSGAVGYINASWIDYVSHEYFYKGGLVGVDAFYSVEWAP